MTSTIGQSGNIGPEAVLLRRGETRAMTQQDGGRWRHIAAFHRPEEVLQLQPAKQTFMFPFSNAFDAHVK